MEALLRNIGLVTVLTALLVVIKRKYDRIYLQQEVCYENCTVYRAADKFAAGASVEQVRDMLATCYEFDEREAEEILAQALPGRREQDGGYRIFIQAVNKVSGEEIYRS